MQYFLGYPSFTSDKPFDASLFVDFRKELGLSTINEINEKIVSLKTQMVSKRESQENKEGESSGSVRDTKEEEIESHKGKIIFDATCCPQDIAYPTDLDLLSDAREKAEELIDIPLQFWLQPGTSPVLKTVVSLPVTPGWRPSAGSRERVSTANRESVIWRIRR